MTKSRVRYPENLTKSGVRRRKPARGTGEGVETSREIHGGAQFILDEIVSRRNQDFTQLQRNGGPVRQGEVRTLLSTAERRAQTFNIPCLVSQKWYYIHKISLQPGDCLCLLKRRRRSSVIAGEVAAGDCIKVIDRDPSAVPVSEITRLYVVTRYGKEEIASLRRALLVDALPESWKVYFHNRLQKTG